jgi:hypothetical protein
MLQANLMEEIDFSKAEDDISKDSILNCVSELEIFRYYLKSDFKIRVPMSSPLRKDNKPSFNIYIAGNGKPRFYDFGMGAGGDCFDFVQAILGVDYKTTLRIIHSDLVNTNKSKVLTDLKQRQTVKYDNITDIIREEAKEQTTISIVRQPYTFLDTEYWKSYGINMETLLKFKVFSAKTVWINKNEVPISYSATDPIYAFEFKTATDSAPRYKIYKPLAPSGRKWVTNTRMFDIIGWNQLCSQGNLAIITKSMKDVMVLHELGFNAISPQSESQNIGDAFLTDLKTRFKSIVSLFDRDATGVRAATKLVDKWHIPPMFIQDEKAKDISDFVRHYGASKAKDLIVTLASRAIDKFVTYEYLTNRI